MPSGPLYFGPLVDAYAKSALVKDVPAVDRAAAQVNFEFPATGEGGTKQIAPATSGAEALVKDEKTLKGVDRTFTGLHALHDARKGAQSLNSIKLAVDAEGYVANRTVTLVDNHFDEFEYKDLNEAYQLGGAFAKQAAGELEHGAQATFGGQTLDLGPGMARILQKQWAGKEPVTPEEAVAFGTHVGRELERAVTPLPPDASHKVIGWIEDATIDLLGAWPGNIEAVAKAAGLDADPKLMAPLVEQTRSAVWGGANADANKTLMGVLDLAGVDVGKPEHRGKAVAMLQDVKLEQTPEALALGIAAQRKLPPDKVEWLAGRIVDLGGRPGNVGGLRAELEKLPPAP